MTSTDWLAPASRRTKISLTRQIVGWIRTRQQALSDRAHAHGDVYAVAQGWTVTASTGRSGFGTRIYRDPRFDTRQAPGPSQRPARGTSSTLHPVSAGRQRDDV
jgi:hypothetical protein